MGLFTNYSPQQELHPVNPPLGIYPNFTAKQPTMLTLREHAFSFSGDDFTVKDNNGYPVIRCEGQAFSFRGRKVITDPNGQLLFQLTNKMFSFQPTYEAEDANGQPLFMVRKRFGFSTKMEATFRNHSTGQETIIDLNGDFWGGAADLSIQGGSVIAQITRDAFSAREILSNSQQYFVTVAPGVDLALVAAICICFDEAKNDRKNKGFS